MNEGESMSMNTGERLCEDEFITRTPIIKVHPPVLTAVHTRQDSDLMGPIWDQKIAPSNTINTNVMAIDRIGGVGCTIGTQCQVCTCAISDLDTCHDGRCTQEMNESAKRDV